MVINNCYTTTIISNCLVVLAAVQRRQVYRTIPLHHRHQPSPCHHFPPQCTTIGPVVATPHQSYLHHHQNYRQIRRRPQRFTTTTTHHPILHVLQSGCLVAAMMIQTGNILFEGLVLTSLVLSLSPCKCDFRVFKCQTYKKKKVLQTLK